MRQRKKIVFIHLRDDLSGSTKILSQVLAMAKMNDLEIELFSLTIDYRGFLSKVQGIPTTSIPYKRYDRRYKTSISYLYSQVWLFFRLLSYIREPATIYVNTVLPFGAALAGWLMRKEVIYHIHEISLAPAPPLLRQILFGIVNVTAKKKIYVSDYLRKQSSIKKSSVFIIHNTLDADFLRKAQIYHQSSKIDTSDFNVLMICSLAHYKGVPQFVELAKRMPQFSFDLVLNASKKEIRNIFKNDFGPNNLTIHSAQNDVHRFYEKATVLLNLSLIEQHVETFGMTVLEAMAYGLPCIVPPIGGVLELIDDNINGYLINSLDTDLLIDTLVRLKSDPSLHKRLSEEAFLKSKKFDPERFNAQILEAITD